MAFYFRNFPFVFYDVKNKKQTLTIPKHALCFTYCQVPIVYHNESNVNGIELVLSNGEKKKIDIKYHELGSGYADWLVDEGLTIRLADDESIQHAVSHPPSDTPAWARGLFVNAAQTSHDVSVSCRSWIALWSCHRRHGCVYALPVALNSLSGHRWIWIQRIFTFDKVSKLH